MIFWIAMAVWAGATVGFLIAVALSSRAYDKGRLDERLAMLCREADRTRTE